MRALGVGQESSPAVLGSAVHLPLPHSRPAGDRAGAPGLNHPVSGELLWLSPVFIPRWLAGWLGCHHLSPLAPLLTGRHLTPPLCQAGLAGGGRGAEGGGDGDGDGVRELLPAD